jgi:hypothetical protein
LIFSFEPGLITSFQGDAARTGESSWSPPYREERSGEWVRHSATYTKNEVDDLFNLVYAWDDTEVLVNNRNIPYGSSLWLPLIWFYRIE